MIYHKANVTKALSAVVLAAGLCIAIPAQAALVLHINFDGNVNDQSGNGNNGTLIGSPTYNASVPFGGGQSISYNGVDQGVNIAGAASLDSNQMTMAYFVNPNGATQSGPFERLTSRGGDTFETAINGNNELAYFSPGPGWITIAAGAVAGNDWTHVAWRSSGTGATDMELFVDGVSVFTGPGVSAGNPQNFLNVGIRHNATEGYEGLMDDFRLYDTALSNAEIAGLVPEPSGVMLLLAGFAGFALRRRR